MSLELGNKPKKTKKESNKNFEIVLLVRDKEGNPTGQTKSHATDDASSLHAFWIRNSPPKKKNKKRKSKVAQGNQVNTALKEIKTHTDKVRTDKGLKD